MNKLINQLKKAWDWFDWGGKATQGSYEKMLASRVEKSDAERISILDQEVFNQVSRGATVVLRTDFEVVLLYANKANHVLHFILSLLTVGFWLIIWFFIALGSKPKRYTYSIDRFGVITSR